MCVASSTGIFQLTVTLSLNLTNDGVAMKSNGV